MSEIRLTSTLTRRKEVLHPVEPGRVGMYLCGPTVYDRAHLGNARNVVLFDVLYRLLRHEYGAENVTYVRNITDVDDRINETARARKEAGAPGTLEALIHERADETIRWYHEDMGALGCLPPDHEPRATEHIAGMIAMIETLIAGGHAYEADGHVLFAVDSYADYGRLSGRSVEDMIAGARVEVAPYKKNPMDFVLWKPSDADLPGWDSPWGRGRPGWHIECSAMSKAILGERFDIHGGGLDLAFPHHENEIAQSCCANAEPGFASIWLHNEMLQVEGKKMSKSLGNFFTVRDLIEKYDQEFGIENIGPALRLRLLEAHYRSPLDASTGYVEAASTKLSTWAYWLKDFDIFLSPERRKEILAESPGTAAICDDLNTPRALSIIDGLINDLKVVPPNNSVINEFADSQERIAEHALALLELLGFDLASMWALHHSQWSQKLARRTASSDPDIIGTIEGLIAKRNNARRSKDFARADEIRDALISAGLSIEDNPEGTTWEMTSTFDPSKLEGV